MKLTSRVAMLLIAGCAGGALLRAQAPAPGTLLVLAKGDRTLAFVDPVSFDVLGKVPSGPDPHEVVVSTDGRTAYISNYNGGVNKITVVDLVARKTLDPIDLGPLRAPHGLVFVGGKLWFTAEGAKVIGSYDPASAKVDWILGTGQNRTHMLFVFPDLQRIVTSNVSSATMTFIDKATPGGRGGPGGPPPGGGGNRGGGPQGDWDETVIPVGPGAEGFDVSPDLRRIWAANAGDGTISIIDVPTKKLIQTLPANVGGANRLKFTPDGKYVFVSTLSGPDLVIFNASSRTEVKRLKIGTGAAGIEIAPDGLRAYVACTPDSYVAVIDVKTLDVAGHIDAGRQPDGLAWAVRK